MHAIQRQQPAVKTTVVADWHPVQVPAETITTNSCRCGRPPKSAGEMDSKIHCIAHPLFWYCQSRNEYVIRVCRYGFHISSASSLYSKA